MGPQKLIKKEQDRPAPPRWTTPDACPEKIERLQKRVMELVETLGQDIALSKKMGTCHWVRQFPEHFMATCRNQKYGLD